MPFISIIKHNHARLHHSSPSKRQRQEDLFFWVAAQWQSQLNTGFTISRIQRRCLWGNDNARGAGECTFQPSRMETTDCRPPCRSYCPGSSLNPQCVRNTRNGSWCHPHCRNWYDRHLHQLHHRPSQAPLP